MREDVEYGSYKHSLLFIVSEQNFLPGK